MAGKIVQKSFSRGQEKKLFAKNIPVNHSLIGNKTIFSLKFPVCSTFNLMDIKATPRTTPHIILALCSSQYTIRQIISFDPTKIHFTTHVTNKKVKSREIKWLALVIGWHCGVSGSPSRFLLCLLRVNANFRKSEESQQGDSDNIPSFLYRLDSLLIIFLLITLWQ